MAKISQACQNFADKCVLNGFVPPHPGDLKRGLKEMNLLLIPNDLTVPPQQNNNIINNNDQNINIQNNNENENPQDNPESVEIPNSSEAANPTDTDDNLSSISESISNISTEDLESIKSIAQQQKNYLSQFTINKIHSKIPNIAPKDIRNCIRALISRGELNTE